MNQLSDYHRERVQAVLAASPLVPVIAIKDPDDAIPLCRALVDGGIRVLEITLRTEHGVRAIEKVRKAIPEAWVGAGTVTSIAQYRQVESAGAQFVITPGVTEAILEFGVTSEAPLLPGISTVSELMMGYALGYREFKFFPAEVAGGIPALKAFSGPFPDVVFCPTGGISRQTARDYLALPNVRAVGGSWLTPAEAIAGKDWPAVSDIARGSLGDL
ncbi:bifunctional 4-hydroxy-2-oxoglutarate aldolase/2-dehydro-3-deoxy-phosphogluconate aldolase [Marinobacter nauticus]|uniref:bifunctional 4-hydroxy-2-oxoglutarate aldolase/2-dehydro-3-deoxy-phosphogluconate aldolase n=1 Tax=Marinobacter nauticus TaxID=2743 RepID=UPI001C97A799|nr:bifunctional 4-hydroxy-2-oxoglutarate aldolase/2-dehydro-3-deoxy-phosphogluconate aldolase [Marinobacter nauticus]MBY5962077.1 bifunctional 4-hydroxy-2-oxoglutarate aldolase/2-dehydro-3-deoxy-phosphogluconate aldolase [Marinobacter nauticus]MBY6102625.1 bifunctional 4-hydroxy-2-oxoglutarate aldolase/2-dehydro-3-deoxy-phosphogluconate aldolase [Marinobacter nauticus]